MIQPVLDRILLRRVVEEQSGLVVRPEKYAESDKYEVLAIGDFVVMGGLRFSVSEIVGVGEFVLVSEYNIESFEDDGETYHLARVQDIRGKKRAKARTRTAS